MQRPNQPFRLLPSLAVVLALLTGGCSATGDGSTPSTRVPTMTTAPAPAATPTLAPKPAPTWPAAEDTRELCALSSAAPPYDLVVMDAAGGRRRVLSQGASRWDLDAAWSPDSRSIVFADTRDDRSGLYVFDVASGQTRLLVEDGEAGSPVWSLDGQWIAYRSRQPGDPLPNLLLVPAAGGEARVLMAGVDLRGALVWRVDGSLVFASGADGGWVAVSPDDPTPRPTTPEQPADARLSPDGRYILREHGDDILRANADGSDLRNLTDRPGDDLDPRWSPDGASILYRSERNPPLVDPSRAMGEPFPMWLSGAGGRQWGALGPFCWVQELADGVSQRGTPDPLANVGIPAGPLAVAPGETLTVDPGLSDLTGLTLTIYDAALAAQLGAVQHGTFAAPCAPPDQPEGACRVALLHALTFSAPTAPGRYLVIVSAAYARPHEHGYSTQGFQIAVVP